MTDAPHPFSKPFSVLRLPPGGEERRITASPAECAGIAALLGLPGVLAFSARLLTQPGPGGVILLTGDVKASYTQVCAVSLEEFPVEAEEQAEMRFSLRQRAESEPDLDQPDPVIDGNIDLGAAAVETLALSLDAYPRKPGAEFAFESAGPNIESPFAALAALKKGGNAGRKG